MTKGDHPLCPLCQSDRTAYFATHAQVEQRLYRCQECGLFFVHPHRHLPSPDDQTAHVQDGQEKSGFWGPARAADAWDKWRATENERIGRLVLQAGEASPLLEVGFGEGPLTRVLMPKVDEYWGIEPYAPSFERAVSELALDRSRFFCLKAETLEEAEPFATMSDYFRTIIMVSVFEHLSQPARILQTCRRLLSPGGRLIISVPDSARFRWLRLMRLTFGLEPWTYYHLSFFNQRNLEQAFVKHGFSVISKKPHPLIDDLSIDYFYRVSRSRLVGLGMKGLSMSRLDRLLRIVTWFYVLEKQ